MLISSPRHTREDLRVWADHERMDKRLFAAGGTKALEGTAVKALCEFFMAGAGYISVSWGKDSVVVADLAARVYDEIGSPPVVWFPAGAIENPDCILVRDAFLAMHDVDYHEVEAALSRDHSDGSIGHDGAQVEFERAAKRFGRRYVSGVRAEESSTRRMTMGTHGLVSSNSCRPIGHWNHHQVFAYLAGRDLPVHPAYACTMGGAIDRGVIRVSTIGGERGRRFGRAEWERFYYGRDR